MLRISVMGLGDIFIKAILRNQFWAGFFTQLILYLEMIFILAASVFNTLMLIGLFWQVEKFVKEK